MRPSQAVCARNSQPLAGALKTVPTAGFADENSGLASTVSTLKEVSGPPTRRLINPFQHRQLSVRRSSAPWHDKNGTGSLASSPRPVRSAISIAQPWPFCAAYGCRIEATEALQKYGAIMKSPTGLPIQSPYLAIANRQAETMMRIASEFGFTPASRGRLWMVANSDSKLLELEDLDADKAKW
jgi:hypothetical protein